MKLNVKGTVTIKDNLGSVISTETDFCQTDDSKPNFGGLIEKHCDFDSAGRVKRKQRLKLCRDTKLCQPT